ncbi:SURF1 family protein [Mesobacterium sp. TK19101]|uniref:SURF1-like protein n=1 Tax=Mesobacterium hydrothermale TaxID=3111907 RepID=A0ABU6HHT8_9RHOB|nr:SURF1 family protein [Mesobacterium sp. TK19101]MEC3862020.1 SURF1 family protein [Mesobacterium sp. TK19101]
MKRILAPLLFGLIGAGILVWLGTWQIQRLAWKQGILSEIESTISGDPIPLPAQPAPENDRYKPVNLTGTIGPGELHVLMSIKQVGAGFRIIAPLTLDDGRKVLLDRGFVPVEDKTKTRRIGQVTVSGNLHWSDDRNSSTPDNDVNKNMWFARDLDQMAAQLGTEPVLIVARRETPADPGLRPVPVDTAGIPNDHLQYAITWYSLAVVWLIMTAYFIRRTLKPKEA